MSENKTPNEIWIQEQKKALELIEKYKKLEGKDRLDIFARWQTLHGILCNGVNGWGHWISNAQVLQRLPKETLEEYYNAYLAMVEQYVQLDIIATENMEKIMATEEKDWPEPKKTKIEYSV